MTAPAPVRVSRERLLREAKHYLYRTDFERFAREQLKISPKEGQLVPFDIRNRPAQVKVHGSITTQLREDGFARHVLFKTRQQGGSTYPCGLNYAQCSLNKHTHGFVVAHDKETAETLFNKIKIFYNNVDPEFRPMVKHATKGEFVFDNPDAADQLIHPGLGSRIIIATARNIHAGTGHTLNFVHLSEVARYERPQDLQSAVFDTCPLGYGSIIIMESTGFFNPATDNWFKSFCDEIRSGKFSHNPWQFTFSGWNEDPTCVLPMRDGETLDYTETEADLAERFALTPAQIKWRRAKVGEFQGNEDLFRQSYALTYEEGWLVAGESLFTPARFEAMAADLRDPMFQGDVSDRAVTGSWFRADPDGPLSIWDWPDPREQYDIGVDPSMGIGQHYSVAQVLRRRDKAQVAMYRSNRIAPGTEGLVEVLDWLGRAYHLAQIAVEVNPGGGGHYTNTELAKRYPNLYIRKQDNKLAGLGRNPDLGWLTTPNSKARLVSMALDWIGSGRVTIRDRQTVNELRAFRRYSDKLYGALPGWDDDTVMALFIGLRASVDETVDLGTESPSATTSPLDDLDPAYYDRGWDDLQRRSSRRQMTALEEMAFWE